MGSERAQRPEVGQLSRSFQSNQPTLNPIRERSGRSVITYDVIAVQDGRKTSRSQEIDVNSFHEEPSSSEQTGRLVETNVIQTRSFEDRKDFNVEQIHERTGRPVITHDVINVSDSSHATEVPCLSPLGGWQGLSPAWYGYGRMSRTWHHSFAGFQCCWFSVGPACAWLGSPLVARLE